jgi:hypothetical protein
MKVITTKKGEKVLLDPAHCPVLSLPNGYVRLS